MIKPHIIKAEEIDALLPQTQCGLCGFSGCMPYAEALASRKESAIDLCPPGGVNGLIGLGNLLKVNPDPFIEEMTKKAKPPLVAVIRENECIGCTKCIQACPVDAILGGSKQIHTVIADECSGCELCIAPCPVDCIDLIPVTHTFSAETNAKKYRKRYQERNKRLAETITKNTSQPKRIVSVDKKTYISMALNRVKEKAQK